ncbi:MAG TPA: GDSL-type esterase/lipase family protein [Thermoleophilaceae bacterium]|nr:GDSL-type esterase/lipase family protein [Thermoleophilaceae bacterium]
MRTPVRPAGRTLATIACAAIALLAAAGDASAAAPRYLALGDSVTFGYQEQNVQPPPTYKRPETLQGYPEHMGAALDLRVANAACPGESSASFIDPTAQSFGCENYPGAPNVGYRRFYPLHVSYKGSQLAYATSFLKQHPRTRLVSLMIGANDLFICQATTSHACTSQAEREAVLTKVTKNVRRIVSAIRNKAGYDGQLVIVHYFSLDYSSPQVNATVRALNAAQDAGAKGFRFDVANGFEQFRRGSAKAGGSPCRAGLLTQLKGGGCGVHPSYAGQGLLALAVERPFSR